MMKNSVTDLLDRIKEEFSFHQAQNHRLVEIFGDDACLQFGGGTLGHPWGNAPGAAANRIACEACIQARNEGRSLAAEGNQIIRDAAKWSPELAAACEVWKEIKFEFETIDTL